ncbi:hypothetical protein AOLI_G00016970 [Acnodon oligacanthus]
MRDRIARHDSQLDPTALITTYEMRRLAPALRPSLRSDSMVRPMIHQDPSSISGSIVYRENLWEDPWTH